mmetsp:Transcript_17146/g.36030  ORF Transcript_17146/g.36030 Transcript_17146/m.36030 type:complete len:323 (-) Transcript_17146:307-1275(-)
MPMRTLPPQIVPHRTQVILQHEIRSHLRPRGLDPKLTPYRMLPQLGRPLLVLLRSLSGRSALRLDVVHPRGRHGARSECRYHRVLDEHGAVFGGVQSAIVLVATSPLLGIISRSSTAASYFAFVIVIDGNFPVYLGVFVPRHVLFGSAHGESQGQARGHASHWHLVHLQHAGRFVGTTVGAGGGVPLYVRVGTPIQPFCRLYSSLLLIRLLIWCRIFFAGSGVIVSADGGFYQRPQCTRLQCGNVIYIHGIVRIEPRFYDDAIFSGIVRPTEHLVGSGGIDITAREEHLAVVVRVENVLTGLTIAPSSWFDPDAVIGIAPDH